MPDIIANRITKIHQIPVETIIRATQRMSAYFEEERKKGFTPQIEVMLTEHDGIDRVIFVQDFIYANVINYSREYCGKNKFVREITTEEVLKIFTCALAQLENWM